MGWTTYYREPGQTDLEHLRGELFAESERYELIAGATVRNVFYGAVRNHTDGTVWALVVLQSRGRDRYGHNYGYKDMEESQGPCEDRCPARILDLLSDPPENEWAAQWRERCRANLEHSAAQPKISTGARFRVSAPWKFADGASEDTFDVADARRRRFRRVSDGQLVRLPAKSGWPSFEIIERVTA